MIVVRIFLGVEIFEQNVGNADAPAIDAFFEIFCFFKLVEEFVAFGFENPLENRGKSEEIRISFRVAQKSHSI